MFRIKSEDIIKIKLDEKTMFNQLSLDLKIENRFIVNRIKFIKQLAVQRKLKIQFELINQKDNLANNVLEAKELKTKNE